MAGDLATALRIASRDAPADDAALFLAYAEAMEAAWQDGSPISAMPGNRSRAGADHAFLGR